MEYNEIIVERTEDGNYIIILDEVKYKNISDALEKRYKSLDSSVKHQRSKKNFKGNIHNPTKPRYKFILK